MLGASGRQFEQWAGRRVHTYQLVHELVQQGKLPGEDLLTHTFALADYRRALAVATDKGGTGCVKVAFDLAGGPTAPGGWQGAGVRIDSPGT